MHTFGKYAGAAMSVKNEGWQLKDLLLDLEFYIW